MIQTTGKRLFLCYLYISSSPRLFSRLFYRHLQFRQGKVKQLRCIPQSQANVIPELTSSSFQLNYYLGARAKREGRDAAYPSIDFCRDPEAICSSSEHPELKWVAGMFYWLESVQKYDERGWNYMEQLHKFVDEGMTGRAFIDAVSGIVNRGCHE